MKRGLVLAMLLLLLIPFYLSAVTHVVPNGEKMYDPVRNTDWGTDIVMKDGMNARTISYDQDINTKTMYTAMFPYRADTSTVPDTIFIYKSVDGGNTWYPWYTIPNYSSNKILDIKILAVQDADTPYVALFSLWKLGSVTVLYCSRFPESDSSYPINWKIISEYNDSINVHSFDAAQGDSFLYVVYNETDTTSASWFPLNLWFKRAKIDFDSTGWSNGSDLAIYEPVDAKPAITAAMNNVFVAFIDTIRDTLNDNVYIRRSTDRGAHWGTVCADSNPNKSSLSDLSIACTYDDTATVWLGITARDTVNDVYRTYFRYSQNNGQSFFMGDTLMKNSGDDQTNLSMAMGKRNLRLTIAFKESYYNYPIFINEVVVDWIMPSSPKLLQDSLIYASDSHAFLPVAGNAIGNNGYEFGCVLFQGFANNRVYFDSYYNTTGINNGSVSSDKTIFAISRAYQSENGTVKVELTTGKKVPIKATVYNLSGQRIADIYNGMLNVGKHTLEWNGKDMSSLAVSNGVYLIKVNAGDFSKTAKVLLLK